MFSLEAIPQALLCFNIANVGSSNSHINWTAELMSSKLLYEISFPLSFRKVSSRLPKKTAFLITSQALGMNTLMPKGGARRN